MTNVLLFGNGLNRLSNRMSWSDLLDSVWGKDLGEIQGVTSPRIPQKLPYPLQYDFILFNSRLVDKYKDADGTLVMEDRQLALKESLVERVGKFKTNDVYVRLGKLPFDTYLTTNYDHAFDEALAKLGYEHGKSNNQEKLYNIRRYRKLIKEGSSKTIYPIHGDVTNPKSIVIDYNHYCGTLGKLDEYLKGRAKWEGMPLSKMEERLQMGDTSVRSWIDHFFFSDIHILGFGFDFSEIDLWWILDRRKLLILRGFPITNHIFFHEVMERNPLNIEDGLSDSEQTVRAKYEILGKMDVTCRIHIVDEGDYMKAYMAAVEEIESYLL